MTMALRPLLCRCLLVLSLPVGTALAHDLQYSTSNARAVVIKLFYVNNKPFSFEDYEISREGDKLPYQVGRTDSQGRIAFLPDRAGAWRVRAISQDGHGLDFTLASDAAAYIESSEKPLYERYGRIVVGIALILGLFCLLSLLARKKKS